MMSVLSRNWRLLVLLLTLAALVLLGWMMRDLAAERDAARAAARQAGIDLARVQATDAITRQVDASATATAARRQSVDRTIHDKVIQYVYRKDSSAGCLLDFGWVRLHDAAARGRVPDTSGAADAVGPAAGGDRTTG